MTVEGTELEVGDTTLKPDGYGAVDVYGPKGDYVGTISAAGLLDAAVIHENKLNRLAAEAQGLIAGGDQE